MTHPSEQTGHGASPLVSVITVCLNAERHLATAMESVLTQGYPRIEYIVIDGVSSDGTLDVIRKYEPRFDGRMRWISEPDVGLYDAMNKGVAMATGELIGILNADDFYEADAVERAVATWTEHPEAGVIYGDAQNVDDNDAVVLERPAPAEITMPTMMRGMLICHQSMFVSASTYAEVGRYDTRYKILADYEFILRCLRMGTEFANIAAPLSNFRLGGISGSFARGFDLELTQIRISYGASPVTQWALYWKHVLSAFTYDRLKWSPLFRRLYQKYRSEPTEDTSAHCSSSQ